METVLIIDNKKISVDAGNELTITTETCPDLLISRPPTWTPTCTVRDEQDIATIGNACFNQKEVTAIATVHGRSWSFKGYITNLFIKSEDMQSTAQVTLLLRCTP